MAERVGFELTVGYLSRLSPLISAIIHANEQLSCSEMTGFRARSERCCGDLGRLRRALGPGPPGRFAGRGCGGGREGVEDTSEDPITRPKSNSHPATRT